jgi:hypothetical protein
VNGENFNLSGSGPPTLFGDSTTSPKYVFFQKESSISKPAAIWLTIDEDGHSIDDGLFLVDMAGTEIFEAPARRHANAFSWNFCDGHSEIYSLKDSSMIHWPVETTAPQCSGIPTANNVDWTNI